MSLAAGRLRHRIELQAPVEVRDPVTGLISHGWETKATVRAAIEHSSAREFIQSQAMQAQITARITIRYRADVQPTWRALYRGRIYNIHGVLPDLDSGLEYLTLPVSEGVNDG